MSRTSPMLDGDLATGKAVLHDCMNATIGIEDLGAATGTPPKRLMRMFGPRGNLQKQAGFRLEVRPGR